MNLEPWLHAYATTPEGAAVRDAITAGDEAPLATPEALAYRNRWNELQATIRARGSVNRSAVRSVTRTLVDVAQADSSAAGKIDLAQPMHDLLALPGGAGDYFHELLAAAPDRALLRRVGAAFNARSRFEKEGMQSTATLYFQGGDAMPESLGGEWGPEVMRAVTVSCRYAKWRDRRVRRLARVQVAAFDIAPA